MTDPSEYTALLDPRPGDGRRAISGSSPRPASDRLSRRGSRIGDWIVIAGVLLTVLVTGPASGFALEWRSWLLPACIAASLLLLSWFYDTRRRIDDGRIAETLHETAILVTYGPPAAALSYIVLAPALPLRDEVLAGLDLSMGLDWPAFYLWVHSTPESFQTALAILYASSLPHIGAVLIATGLAGRTDRTRELNALLIATSLPMVLISGLMPAMSAWIHHGLGVEKAYHLAHVTGLRDGSFRVLEVGNLLGIITFPSFHTAITLVLLWVSRGIPWLWLPTVVLGIGQLVSIPIEGGHYFADMLAAVPIVAAGIAWTRWRATRAS